MESAGSALSRTPLTDSKKAGYYELGFGALAQTTVRALLLATGRRREATLLFSGEYSNTLALSRGLVSIPTPARQLSPWATPEKNRVQPFSRSLVPEPALCLEVSPTRSSWYCSTSCTSSGSFPASEVTFHVPRASLCCRRSARPGPLPGQPPGLHSTRRRCLSLWVVGPQGGCSMFFLQTEPERPHKRKPGHQTLVGELPSWVWLREGALVSLVRVR